MERVQQAKNIIWRKLISLCSTSSCEQKEGEGTMKTSVPLNPLTDLLGNKTGGEEENLLLLFKWLLIADC